MSRGKRAARPDAEHPRERLLRTGARSLSDAELVEILLRNGCRGSTVKELARELLAEFGGLVGVTNIDPLYLRRHGIGDAKAATLVAAFEVACRVAKARMPPRDILNHPESVARYLTLRYGLKDQEVVGALYLDLRNRLIGEADVFRGTLRRAAVEPRAILKRAILLGASGLLLFHGHPSGDPTPSEEDVVFTRRMSEAGDLLGVRLIDHLVLGANGRWVSLGRRGAW